MTEDEIVNIYNSGLNIKQICDKYNLTRYAVVRTLDRRNIKIRKNGRAPQPLRPEEIPPEHRLSFNYNNQFLDTVGSNRRGLVIERICFRCSQGYTIPVQQIRGDLKRHKMRDGRCKNCTGRVINKDGYIWILRPSHPNAYSGKYVPEHILVMEESIGRFLDTKQESVHHINGDKTDNRIENLQLRTRYHGKGQVRYCMDCNSINIGTKPL